VKNIGFPIEC